MNFKAKIFKLGNSRAIYLPKKVYTLFKNGDEVELEVMIRGLPLSAPLKDWWQFNTKKGVYEKKQTKNKKSY